MERLGWRKESEIVLAIAPLPGWHLCVNTQLVVPFTKGKSTSQHHRKQLPSSFQAIPSSRPCSNFRMKIETSIRKYIPPLGGV